MNNSIVIKCLLTVRMTPTGSHVWRLGLQGVELSESFRRIRECDLVGGSVSLEGALKFHKPLPCPVSPLSPLLFLLLLLVDQDVAVSDFSSALSARHHAPCHGDNGLNLCGCKPASS